MKKIFAAILAVAALALGTVVPAEATEAKVAAVGAITCQAEDSCFITFAPNEGAGYWMARRWNGSTWVRLTLVPGWSTTNIAPITCQWASSCVIDYTGPVGSGYWMARQANGTIWVRLTLVNGA